jgi:hypothetical protein
VTGFRGFCLVAKPADASTAAAKGYRQERRERPRMECPRLCAAPHSRGYDQLRTMCSRAGGWRSDGVATGDTIGGDTYSGDTWLSLEDEPLDQLERLTAASDTAAGGCGRARTHPRREQDDRLSARR